MNPLAEFALTCIGVVCVVIVAILVIVVGFWVVLIGGAAALLYYFWPWSAVVAAVLLVSYLILHADDLTKEFREKRRRKAESDRLIIETMYETLKNLPDKDGRD